jgi:hypothetical protein
MEALTQQEGTTKEVTTIANIMLTLLLPPITVCNTNNININSSLLLVPMVEEQEPQIM